MNNFRRSLWRLAAGVAITGALAGATAGGAAAAYDPSDPAQKAQYDQALNLGTQGYVFGVTLLDTERAFQNHTSMNVCDGPSFRGAVNQFCPNRELVDASFRSIVTPNQDTLYSNAWLDLEKDPMVVRVPETDGRLNVLHLFDPYTETHATIGEDASGLLPPGDYVITGPKDHGKHIPAGLTEIKAPYNRMWFPQRLYVDNTDPADRLIVHALQDATKLVPLKDWKKVGFDYTPAPPKTPDTTPSTPTIPGTQPGDDPLAFFDALNVSMGQFRPTTADKPLIDQLKTVGIEPGGKALTGNKKLSDATLAGLNDSIAAGKAAVNAALNQMFAAGFNAKNGYLVPDVDVFGTDYALRAVVAQVGLGALPKNVAVYPIALTDRTAAPLSSSKRYVLHFNGPGNSLLPQLPIPVDAFWSVTMYGDDRFFVENELDRYLINDRSDVTYNADGSLDIYIQPTKPTNPDHVSNWLPAPTTGGFRLVTRLYGPQADKIDGIVDGSGWKSGTILPCTPSGSTPAFPPGGITAPIACAG